MKVLVSLLTEKVDDINLARRKVAYDQLVLVVHPGAEKIADQVVAAERDEDVVDTVSMEMSEVDRAVEELRRVLAGLDGEADVTLNAAGGHAGLVTALILLAYEEGLETLFIQEGHVEQLPVLEGLRLEDRLTEEEGVLLGIEAGRSLDELAEQAEWTRRKVERVCRGLEEKGLGRLELVEGEAGFRWTRAGKWVRGHLPV